MQYDDVLKNPKNWDFCFFYKNKKNCPNRDFSKINKRSEILNRILNLVNEVVYPFFETGESRLFF
jgi:hypothetical protein